MASSQLLPTSFHAPTLPLEIIDRIIDFVAGLKVKKLRANLATCSLVCHAWIRRSRYHFFRNCRLLVHLNNTLNFGILLRSPACTILPHLETLTLRNNGESFFHRIQDALKLLTNLQSLRLCGWAWDVYGTPPACEFLSCLPSVVDLEIDCQILGDFDNTVQTFCALPSMKRLAVRRVRKPKMVCTWRCTPPRAFVPRVPLLSTPPQLSSLLLDTRAIIPIVHWLNGAGPHHLTTLEISLPPIDDTEDLLPLQQFVQGLSPSLEHFTLSASAEDKTLSQADFERTFDLSAIKNLRTCRFNKLFPELFPRPLECALSSIVRSLASSSLETLTFELEGSCSETLPCIPWDALDKFLSEKNCLKSVVFECPPNNNKGSAFPRATRSLSAIAILKAFPRVEAMGILHTRGNS